MKLKNIIKIGSFVVAGTLPTISKAQYVCQTCPAGTYSSGGLSTTCTPCPSGQTSSAGASSCYTSLSCSGNNVLNASKTQCLSLLNKSRWAQYGSVKGGDCQDITLYPNIQYLIYLRGGDGGGAYRDVYECSEDDYDDCDYVEKTFGIGAYVEYKFTVTSQTSAKICAGESVEKSRGSYPVYSGGGGSWIQIGDEYIVAGGGYGLTTNDGTRYHAYGGGGGAIGSGGSGLTCTQAGVCGRCGVAGSGLDGIGGGRGGSKVFESENRNCGRGFGGEVNPSRLFPRFARSGRLGGSTETVIREDMEAKSSHDSNFSLKLGCQTLKEGCATIYRFNNN